MCGIVGIVKNSECVVSDIKMMLNKINHRGPDGEGIYLDNNIGIGHKRLSIIDLETGKQPMSDTTEKIWITYNGELYNFKELKEILISAGYSFKTNSDTEVIVNSYKHWGIKCLQWLRGMFAFCIVDFEKKLLFLARDIFGIKPLIYRVEKNFFAFSSELNALKDLGGTNGTTGKIQAIEYFLRYQYIPAPHTIYKNIFKLEQGHFMMVDFSGKILKKEAYFKFGDTVTTDSESSKINWEQRVEDYLKESVKAHLISDVPLGLFLSGGIDSTVIAYLLRKISSAKIKAFTIGFNEKNYDELKYAKQVAEKFDFDLIYEVVEPDSLAVLSHLINDHSGEPFGDASVIPTYYLSKLARQHVPLVLSGDGGDEIFGGYYSYIKWMRNYPPYVFQKKWAQKEFAEIPRFATGNAKRYILNKFSFNNLEEWTDQLTITNKEIRGAIWNKEFHNLITSRNEAFVNAHRQAKNSDRFTYGQLMDIQTYLPYSVLAKVDVASMAVGLEVRPPILDKKIEKFIYSLPLNQKYQKHNGKFEGKYVLKKILQKDFSDEFIYRHKQGFASPLNHWFLKNSLGNKLICEKILDNKNLLSTFFNVMEIEQIVKQHSLENDNSGFLWQMLVLCVWLENNKTLNFISIS